MQGTLTIYIFVVTTTSTTTREQASLSTPVGTTTYVERKPSTSVPLVNNNAVSVPHSQDDADKHPGT